jgi:hypothetical protein
LIFVYFSCRPPKAKEAIRNIDNSSQSEWFNWWFVGGKGKKIVGAVLLISVLSLTRLISIMIFHISVVNETISPQAVTGLVVLIGFLVVILLLPNLRRVKVMDVELETEPLTLKKTELESVLLSPSVTFSPL